MKNNKLNVLLLTILALSLFALKSYGYGDNCRNMDIEVDNQTEYTVYIDDMETLSTCQHRGKSAFSGASIQADQGRVRKVWDVGPWEPKGKGEHKHSLSSYGPGAGNQTEAHVILVDDKGKRSDYDAGKINTKTMTGPSKPITLNDKNFTVTLSNRGNVSTGDPGGYNVMGFIKVADYSMKFPQLKVTVTPSPK